MSMARNKGAFPWLADVAADGSRLQPVSAP
jgi:hypothetical protein